MLKLISRKSRVFSCYPSPNLCVILTSQLLKFWCLSSGVKWGLHYGASIDYAYTTTRDPVHINDLNATVLHNLGIDHERFSVKHQGLNSRLTGIEEGQIIKKLLVLSSNMAILLAAHRPPDITGLIPVEFFGQLGLMDLDKAPTRR